jgi:hypothetical protein
MGHGSSPFSGMTVINLSPAVLEELSLHRVSDGVVVSDVEDGSRAATRGSSIATKTKSGLRNRAARSRHISRRKSRPRRQSIGEAEAKGFFDGERVGKYDLWWLRL